MPVIQKPSQLIGILLLMVVNVVWVASSELTKYLFNDLNFARPFFTTYAKSCMFTLFLVRFACSKESSVDSADEPNYSTLENNVSDDDYEAENLTIAEFESISSDIECDDMNEKHDAICSDSEQSVKIVHDIIDDGSYRTIDEPSRNSIFEDITLSGREASTEDDGGKRGVKRVRFAPFREVRKFPDKIQDDAKLARLSYVEPKLSWSCTCKLKQNQMLQSTLYFAPLWFISSMTYQVALVFSSVSSVNLISASSSLFLLVIAAAFGNRSTDRLTCAKLLLVIMNLMGVAIVSQFSASFVGACFSLLSAFTYAAYLFAFSFTTAKYGRIDMNLMFGVVGLFSVLICTPLMIVIHYTNVESQLPLPNQQQMMIILLNGFFCSLFADYLWLYSTMLTNSLLSSLSITLSIPLAMIADTVFRDQSPNVMQIIASIPIMISFIGASFISSSTSSTTNSSATSSGGKSAAAAVPLMFCVEGCFVPCKSAMRRRNGGRNSCCTAASALFKKRRKMKETLKNVMDSSGICTTDAMIGGGGDERTMESVRLMEAIEDQL